MQEIEKYYAKTFNTSAGRHVLEHLRRITIERFLGPCALESELRTLEAQRALVHQIEQMINRGMQNA